MYPFTPLFWHFFCCLPFKEDQSPPPQSFNLRWVDRVFDYSQPSSGKLKVALSGNILYVVRYRTVIHLYSYDCGVVFGPNLVRLDLLCFGTFSVGVNLHTFNYVHINLTAVKLTTKSHNCISFLRETSYRSLTNFAKSTRCYSPPAPSTFYWTFKRFLGEFRYLSTGIFKTC